MCTMWISSGISSARAPFGIPRPSQRSKIYANASPTGITLDPGNPQHLWIVDNGTDRVYQYDNAVSRTGIQSSSASNWRAGRPKASRACVCGVGSTPGAADPHSSASNATAR